MSKYDELKKIIPPDQALANQALSRSLRQVKKIFDTDLPSVATAVSVLESNKDLNLINELTTPLPQAVANFWGNTFPTGTGSGNAVTTNDVIGIAAGATVNSALPVVSNVLTTLDSFGALNSLTANGGTPASAINGVYTVMEYCLANAYTSVFIGPPDTYTIIIPAPLPGQGVYGPDLSFTNVIDAAFTALISNANTAIANIATTYSNLASESNAETTAIANQLVFNQNNLILAGIDIGNVVLGDFANANIQSNANTTALAFVTRLQDLGLDISEGGTAQFLEQVANTNNVSGQGVIASMREGRNIATLNAIGIQTDTQLSDVNLNTPIANNLQDAQYSVAQARANIII